MAVEMVFNELSLGSATDIKHARTLMTGIIHTIKAAAQHGVQRIVRTQSAFYDFELAPGYPVRRWVNDHEVNRDERGYFWKLTNKAPLWDGLPDLYERIQATDCFFESETAKGMTVAFLLDALGISLLSHDRWNTFRLALSCATLADDGGIDENEASVAHASSPPHITHHQDWILRRLRDVRTGMDLWNRRAELFPRLAFCQAVERQLLELSSAMFRPVLGRLFELEDYCQEWNSGGFDPAQLPTKATTESEATLTQYAGVRTFTCPDTVVRVFSWHVRLTPNAWRIHFFPGPQPGSIIVGYIGPHLPTAKFN